MKTSHMKSYLSLIPISARTRRKQNRLTLICIILAVFLVTSIFSIVDIWTEIQEKDNIRRHGNYHIILNGISEEEADRIAGQSDVAAAAWYRAVSEKDDLGYRVGGKRTILYGTEQAYVYEIRNYETEGTYPQSENEVMLSVDAKEQLGLRTGDSITLNTPAGDFAYTVSGFCVDDTEYNAEIDGFCVYMDLEAVKAVCAANEEGEKPVYYIQFHEGTKFKEAIAGIKEQYGLSDENVKENTMVLGLNGASGDQRVNGLYQTAMAVFLMIVIAGMLMISSCMNSNVSQRIKFFGMMRCIGASKRQVMHYVRLEALNWCKTAVPIGCVLGTAFTWIMCIFLKNMVGGEFSEFSFRLSIVGIVCGILVGVVTVLLAAHSPAKRAAGVPPMAAVSGNAETGKKISHAANTRLFKVETGLGVFHAISAKKNLILMSLSFAFTVILFLTFSAGLDFAKRLLPSESDFNPDISIVSVDNTHTIERGLKDEISSLPGVEAVFGNAFAYNTPARINGVSDYIDLISYDDYLFNWSKKSVVSGDLSKIAGDSNYAMTIFSSGSRLNTGDKIEIGDTELEIAGVVSEGIGTMGRPAVVCTEETFMRITGEKNYVLLNAQFNKDITEETVEEIRILAGENEFADRREDNQTSHSSFWVFRIAAYGFLAIISLITVFNIMNSISMSVSARMKQYGAMRAVGMSARQVTRMIAAEAATYAACGLAIGLAAGLFLHRLLTNKLIVEHFGGAWKIPLGSIAIIVLIVGLSCVIAVCKPAKRIREISITDTINEFI